MASKVRGRQPAWNSSVSGPNGRASTTALPPTVTPAPSLAIVTTARLANGMTNRQVSVPSAPTVIGQ